MEALARHFGCAVQALFATLMRLIGTCDLGALLGRRVEIELALELPTGTDRFEVSLSTESRSEQQTTPRHGNTRHEKKQIGNCLEWHCRRVMN